MASNQPLGFAALIGGGVLLAAAVSGSKVSDVFQGKVTSLTDPSGTVTAGGSFVGALTSKAANAAGYVNPFAYARGVVGERIDMGVDYRMRPGTPIVAPADTEITAVQPWGGGAGNQPIIVGKILSGPEKGRFYYLAEQIDPLVKVGDRIAAGQPLARYASSGTGIEMGFASGTSVQTLAQQQGTTSRAPTPAGQAFDAFIRALGAPAGVVQPGPL